MCNKLLNYYLNIVYILYKLYSSNDAVRQLFTHDIDKLINVYCIPNNVYVPDYIKITLVDIPHGRLVVDMIYIFLLE